MILTSRRRCADSRPVTNEQRDMEPASSPGAGRLQWVLILLLGAAAIFVVAHFGALREFLALARQARPVWLILALGLQVATYIVIALAWVAVLDQAGSPRPLRRLLPISVAKLFADQAVPGAGLGGHVLLVERLTAAGVPRGTAIATLMISLVGYYVAYAVLALAMLFVLWVHHAATPLLVGLVTTLLIVAVAVPALALWLRRRGSQPLPAAVERIGFIRKILAIVGEAPAALVRDRKLIAKATLCNAGIFLLDSMTLAVCLLALGRPLEPSTAFLAFMAGSISATLAPLPLGLGSFEAAATAMLVSLDVPFAAALTATLLLRGLTLWLPLFPSLMMMRKGLKVDEKGPE